MKYKFIYRQEVSDGIINLGISLYKHGFFFKEEYYQKDEDEIDYISDDQDVISHYKEKKITKKSKKNGIADSQKTEHISSQNKRICSNFSRLCYKKMIPWVVTFIVIMAIQIMCIMKIMQKKINTINSVFPKIDSYGQVTKQRDFTSDYNVYQMHIYDNIEAEQQSVFDAFYSISPNDFSNMFESSSSNLSSSKKQNIIGLQQMFNLYEFPLIDRIGTVLVIFIISKNMLEKTKLFAKFYKKKDFFDILCCVFIYIKLYIGFYVIVISYYRFYLLNNDAEQVIIDLIGLSIIYDFDSILGSFYLNYLVVGSKKGNKIIGEETFLKFKFVESEEMAAFWWISIFMLMWFSLMINVALYDYIPDVFSKLWGAPLIYDFALNSWDSDIFSSKQINTNFFIEIWTILCPFTIILFEKYKRSCIEVDQVLQREEIFKKQQQKQEQQKNSDFETRENKTDFSTIETIVNQKKFNQDIKIEDLSKVNENVKNKQTESSDRPHLFESVLKNQDAPKSQCLTNRRFNETVIINKTDEIQDFQNNIPDSQRKLNDIQIYLNKIQKPSNSLIPNRKNNDLKIISSYFNSKNKKSSVRFELKFDEENQKNQDSSIYIEEPDPEISKALKLKKLILHISCIIISIIPLIFVAAIEIVVMTWIFKGNTTVSSYDWNGIHYKDYGGTKFDRRNQHTFNQSLEIAKQNGGRLCHPHEVDELLMNSGIQFTNTQSMVAIHDNNVNQNDWYNLKYKKQLKLSFCPQDKPQFYCIPFPSSQWHHLESSEAEENPNYTYKMPPWSENLNYFDQASGYTAFWVGTVVIWCDFCTKFRCDYYT